MDESSWQKSCRVKASKRVSQEAKGGVFRQKSEKRPGRRRKTAAVIGIGFLSTVWLTGCVSDEMIIQANWKMQLPDGGKELYHADTGASFHLSLIHI